MNFNMIESLKKNPLIAAAQHENLQLAVDSGVSSIILMNGNLNELMGQEFQNCNRKKAILLHTDLIKGLSNDKEAINFIKSHINPAGIVSTKSTMLRAAKKKGLAAIQRIFLIDSNSLKKSIESIRENDPDVVEVMPAFVYPVIDIIKKEIDKPVVLGGLISKKEHIIDVLRGGADGVSCSNSELWNIDIKGIK
ncbi:glycerol uptake operon antiterminator regulatory protein GlpP (plasmid) [Peptoclostridium acidaminophilum DSM 3953]|uniref:Glycerol uptake operon antiterminator regulatory protein GlpP n=1 Tax=Peptoclostridium acidaminophilum DSM 3953 TaxID=1286171 RepID=W8U9I2_PEPAC|nr:glycerol-3-phosphate responsive antiterminator [Peptoclostridium acidaminophilum]AHM57521.1 glycerol uptake operon antiterminator regulatory protein GlpP [Peptoclostridium acidaminophilum DSM 3953]